MCKQQNIPIDGKQKEIKRSAVGCHDGESEVGEDGERDNRAHCELESSLTSEAEPDREEEQLLHN
jgi:hypothetical protein